MKAQEETLYPASTSVHINVSTKFERAFGVGALDCFVLDAVESVASGSDAPIADSPAASS